MARPKEQQAGWINVRKKKKKKDKGNHRKVGENEKKKETSSEVNKEKRKDIPIWMQSSKE